MGFSLRKARRRLTRPYKAVLRVQRRAVDVVAKGVKTGIRANISLYKQAGPPAWKSYITSSGLLGGAPIALPMAAPFAFNFEAAESAGSMEGTGAPGAAGPGDSSPAMLALIIGGAFLVLLVTWQSSRRP